MVGDVLEMVKGDVKMVVVVLIENGDGGGGRRGGFSRVKLVL